MQTTNLKNLTGPEDWVHWKKSQIDLNTHSDPLKKCAALQATLKNTQDIEMCKGIQDFDMIMTKLNYKYNHNAIIIPALKRQLEELPMANSNQILLNNIKVILDVFQQMVDIKGQKNFDLTVINNLKAKFNKEVKLKHEEFIKSRSESYHSEELDETREFFLEFIKVQARNLEKVIVNKGTTKYSIPKNKCQQCKQSIKQCKCRNNFLKNKESVYNTPNICPCCQSKEPHKGYHGRATLSLGKCPEFQAMTHEDKKKFANKVKACYVCLVPGHDKEQCRITGNCYNCGKAKHHPSLCTEPKRAKQIGANQDTTDNGQQNKTEKIETGNLKPRQTPYLFENEMGEVIEALSFKVDEKFFPSDSDGEIEPVSPKVNETDTGITPRLPQDASVATLDKGIKEHNKRKYETKNIYKQTTLKVKRLTSNATIPTRGSIQAAGYDLYSAENASIESSCRKLIKTDLQIQVPTHTYGRIAPKSSLAINHWLDIGGGVVDEDFRGNVNVCLINNGPQKYKIKKGNQIAQLIITPVEHPAIEIVDEMEKTERGSSGFGKQLL